MVRSDRAQNSEQTPSEYLDEVVAFLHSRGYDTETNVINPSAAVIGCVSRDESDRTERCLCLVETGSDTAISTDHVKYLLKAGKKKDVGNLSLTAPGGISPEAQEAAAEYDIDLIQPDEVLDDTTGFDLAADSIAMPDSSGGTDTGSGVETHSTGAGHDSAGTAEPVDESTGEMAQEQASLVETLVMIIGSGLALIGLAPLISRIGLVVGRSPVAAVLGLIFVFPPLFVAVSAVDDYFNLYLFGSWRARKENVAGIMGIMIIIYGVMLNEAGSSFVAGASGSGNLLLAGGVILFLYSASIYVIQGFFEKRRGSR
ncbi:hypothetical protein ACOZ4N_07235 [Halorientalis pallida]|uniref:hypothetical protein n=1 Tax=Halorientalis pallida TaxID=2479928 RepID=UPI003C703B84